MVLGMKRRSFLQLIGAAVVAPVLPVSAVAAPIVLSEPEFGTKEGVRRFARWSPVEASTTPLCEGMDPMDAAGIRLTDAMNRTQDELIMRAIRD